MKKNLSRINKIFKEQKKLRRDRISSLLTNTRNVNREKELEKNLFEEVKKLYISLEEGFSIPENINDVLFRKISNVEYLSSIIFNFDSFKKDTLKKFTNNNREFLQVLDIWRKLYCSCVPVKFYYLDSSFDRKHEETNEHAISKKMIAYNKITTTNRLESLKVLSNIIFVEFEKYKNSIEENDPKIMINPWDYRDLIKELEPIKERILVEYGMFPGEFKIVSTAKIDPFFKEEDKNTFRLDVDSLLQMQKFSERFSPREFCAPKSFYSENRNLKSNTLLFFWYKIKKSFHLLFTTMNQWHSTITLILTIVILATKK